jgi:hypothetical protein
MIFNRKAKQREARMGQYQQIVDLLSREFDWADHVEECAIRVLTKRDGEFDNTFEFIIDEPSIAQYRLRWYKGDGFFRVAYYPFSRINDEKQARADRLTEQIREIQNG